MKFLDFDLGARSSGQVVIVTMRGVESDVMLMSASDVHNFSAGQQVTFWGGHYRQSPVRVVVPRTGTWHVIVVPGMGGTVEANVKVVSQRSRAQAG